MNPHYSLVAPRAGHRCEYYHAPEAVFNFPFEVEHVLPISRHGTDEETNLCLACRAYNLIILGATNHVGAIGHRFAQ